MSNRWVIEAQNFVAYRLLIDYNTAHERHFSCFLVPFFFSFVILLSVLDAFFLVSEDPVDDVETQSANHKYRWFSIVQYFTLPNSLINNKTTVTNQSENETNKYADKNPLRGYRFFSFCGCLSAK